MSKIKTRETGKDIKVLDKSAVVGQRMKNAFIRSKRNAAALMDDRQTTPNEYAEDKVEFAADDLVHDTANVAVSGTKSAVRQGRKLFQRQREKRTAEKRWENTAPTEQAPAPEPSQGTAPEGQTPQRHSGTAPERQPTPAQAQRSGLRWERRSSGMSELSGLARKRGICSLLRRGGDSRDRTGDLLLARQALSQLSYIPTYLIFRGPVPSKLNNVTHVSLPV